MKIKVVATGARIVGTRRMRKCARGRCAKSNFALMCCAHRMLCGVLALESRCRGRACVLFILTLIFNFDLWICANSKKPQGWFSSAC